MEIEFDSKKKENKEIIDKKFANNLIDLIADNIQQSGTKILN